MPPTEEDRGKYVPLLQGDTVNWVTPIYATTSSDQVPVLTMLTKHQPDQYPTTVPLERPFVMAQDGWMWVQHDDEKAWVEKVEYVDGSTWQPD